MSVDLAAFITGLKEHAIEHGFHIHDERHYIETYSLRQAWEVDLHPEDACGEPFGLQLALDVDPRILLDLQEVLDDMDEFVEPEDVYRLPLLFNWSVPPLPNPPDLLVLATDLAGIGGVALPITVSATDSYRDVTDKPERELTLVGAGEVSLVDVLMGREQMCDTLDQCKAVSAYLLERLPTWLEEKV